VDRLRNDLFESGLALLPPARGGGPRPAPDLMAALLAANARLLARPDDHWLAGLPAARRPAMGKALEKARRQGLMLGLDGRWLLEPFPEGGAAAAAG
jgi:hypothetical protein